ncbi:MAG: hypothetical protein PVI21_01625 [Candidatus Woesebacteria bacterium]
MASADTTSFDITVISSNDANMANLAQEIDSKDPHLVFLNGHGSPDALCGQNNEILISTSHTDLDRYKDKIVHALACEAALKLGPKLIALGAKTFIGYVEPFGFCISKDARGNYIDNGLSSLFIDPANKVVTSLMEGKTARDSYNESQRHCAQSMKDVYSSTDPVISQDRSLILAFLLRNYRSQRVLGDEAAQLP